MTFNKDGAQHVAGWTSATSPLKRGRFVTRLFTRDSRRSAGATFMSPLRR
jgi:hypothetical protein